MELYHFQATVLQNLYYWGLADKLPKHVKGAEACLLYIQVSAVVRASTNGVTMWLDTLRWSGTSYLYLPQAKGL